MTRRLAHRFALALAGILVTTQVALAGFACPKLMESPQQMRQAMAADMPDCHQQAAQPAPMDEGSKTLCYKSCLGEPIKRDVPSVDIPAVAEPQPLRIVVADPSAHVASNDSPDAGIAHATSPPPRTFLSRYQV